MAGCILSFAVQSEMKALVLSLCCAAVCAQETPRIDLTKIADSEVIAIIAGKPMTMGQYKAFAAVVDPANQARSAVDPADLVQQLALMRKLSAMAVEQKLDEQSPTREQLEFQRLYVLTTVETGHILNAPVLHQEEIDAYYAAHREDFKQVKVQAIKITFASPAGEAAAKAKAGQLLEAIRLGTDFVRLVREYSDDAESKAHDGDLQTFSPSSTMPDAFRVVFQLKAGETSEPVKQPDGYYLLRAQEITYKPLPDVQTEVYNQIKQQIGHEAMAKILAGLDVQYPNPAFPPPRKK